MPNGPVVLRVLTVSTVTRATKRGSNWGVGRGFHWDTVADTAAAAQMAVSNGRKEEMRILLLQLAPVDDVPVDTGLLPFTRGFYMSQTVC